MLFLEKKLIDETTENWAKVSNSAGLQREMIFVEKKWRADMAKVFSAYTVIFVDHNDGVVEVDKPGTCDFRLIEEFARELGDESLLGWFHARFLSLWIWNWLLVQSRTCF